MKKLALLMLLSAICIAAHAQIYINFDDTTYRSYVFIDTAHYHHNIWQVGAPHKTVFDTAYSAPHALVTDTSLPYSANDTSVFILKVPKYSGTIGTMPLLYGITFWYQLDIDSNAIATIEFSGDSGTTWKNLLTDTSGIFSFTMGGGTKPDFDTSTHGWKWFTVNSFNFTSGSAVNTALIRFTFIAGSNDSARDGWIIDNIGVQYYSEGLVHQVRSSDAISIFPNPATTQLSIQLLNSVILSGAEGQINSVTIINLLGQTIYAQQPTANSRLQTIDVAAWPAGVYFIKVNDEVRRFVKE